MKLHAVVRMRAHLRVPETEMWERVGPGTESQGPLRCDWVLPCHQNQCQKILTIFHNAAESSDALKTTVFLTITVASEMCKCAESISGLVYLFI